MGEELLESELARKSTALREGGRGRERGSKGGREGGREGDRSGSQGEGGCY